MPGLESSMKLDIVMLVNIALFNKLILDVNIGGLFFDSHFAEPRCTRKEKGEKIKNRNKREQQKFKNPTKTDSLIP